MTYTGVITVPRALPRLIRLPSEGTDDFIFLADLVAYHASRMYHGYDIVSSAAFRVTRNSNLYLAEEESRNLLESVRTELHNRRKGDAVRLEIESEADPEIIERLRTNFGLESWQVFSVNGPVSVSVTAEQKAALDEIAERERVSLGTLVGERSPSSLKSGMTANSSYLILIPSRRRPRSSRTNRGTRWLPCRKQHRSRDTRLFLFAMPG